MTVGRSSLIELGQRAKMASRFLAVAPPEQRDRGLRAAAEWLTDAVDEIVGENGRDVAAAQQAGMEEALVDRLRLTPERVASMADGLRQIAGLPDPVGEVTQRWERPNGLRFHSVRVPLGVVAIIYESRPNVTSDAFGLCLKSGNAAFLRGSSSAIHSNCAIANVIRAAVETEGLPADGLVLVEDVSREAAIAFMQLQDEIDCLIPRGGPSLIASVREHATVPFVIDGAGNCHVVVDAAADLAMAERIVVNAKTQRPGVCNALESLVVDHAVAEAFLPALVAALPGVELVGDRAAQAIAPEIGPATEADFATEYLDLKLSVKVVTGLGDAIAHVNATGSGHSEAIVTNDPVAAERFVREVDAAAVLVNASTRFVDGEEFGFGAEIGISTQKLHARGPMGLRQLTTEKYVVEGDGQIRI